MRIIHVSLFDISGGAARAAYRLHRGLLKTGVDSQMLVEYKGSDDSTVFAPVSLLRRAIFKLRQTLDKFPLRPYRGKMKTPFSLSWLPFSGIAGKINALNPDIVHLHWVCGGMMSVEEISEIKSPIVWSLHDMWAFTGGCHYSADCTGYKKTCGNCNVLGSDRSNDLSHKVILRKKKSFDAIKNLTVVGVSKWLAKCAQESTVFKNNKVISLPNPLDTKAFFPVDKDVAKKTLGISQEKKVVMFGSLGAPSDARKGFKQLREALSKLKRDDIEFAVFGSSEQNEAKDFRFKAHYFGLLRDNVSLRVVYSAADVMVVPSLQEAFGQVASEAMSCGTPVVAFGATGLLDIIDHQVNGYLAVPFDPVSLADGINWILNHNNPETLRQNARQKVLDNFDSAVVVQKYKVLYEKLQ